MSSISNPLLSILFDRVVMYDYEPRKEYNNSVIDINGQLIDDRDIKKAILLPDVLAMELTQRLGDIKSYGEDIMRCYIPHLAFVYYLGNEIKFHVSICLTCNILDPSIDIPAHQIGRGMSKDFRIYLNNLVIANDFSNAISIDGNI